jgi:hypothetical protein
MASVYLLDEKTRKKIPYDLTQYASDAIIPFVVDTEGGLSSELRRTFGIIDKHVGYIKLHGRDKLSFVLIEYYQMEFTNYYEILDNGNVYRKVTSKLLNSNVNDEVGRPLEDYARLLYKGVFYKYIQSLYLRKFPNKESPHLNL